MKQKHQFRPYTCTIQRQQRVDISSFFSSLPALLLFYVLYFYFSVIILLCIVTCSTVFSMSYVLNESKQNNINSS